MTTTPAHLTAALDNPFWRFSLSVYQNEGVKNACLALQDDYYANVNTLLLCCWLAYAVKETSIKTLLQACAEVENWQNEVSQALRKTRRWLSALDKKEPWVEEFTQQVLVQEIVSETYQQHLLFLYFEKKQKKVPAFNEALAIQYLEALFADRGLTSKKPLKSELQRFVILVFAMVIQNEQNSSHHRD